MVLRNRHQDSTMPIQRHRLTAPSSFNKLSLHLINFTSRDTMGSLECQPVISKCTDKNLQKAIYAIIQDIQINNNPGKYPNGFRLQIYFGQT